MFQVDCTSDTVMSLCDLSGARGSFTLKLVILVFFKDYKGMVLLEATSVEICCVGLRVSLDLASALRHS